MGFFSNIKNKARGMANDLAPRRVPPSPMDLDRIMRGPGLNLPDMGMKSDGIRSDPRRSSPPPRQTFEELLASRPGLLSRAPQKRSGLSGLFRKLQEQIKNQQRPQQMPQQNLDFLSRLPQNMMPNLDFSNLPKMSGNPNIPAPDGYELRENEKGMNYFREQLSPEDQAQNMLPRRLDVPFQDFNLKNMRPGFVGGGPLVGRAANLANQVLSKGRMGRDLPGRATSNMGDMVMSGRAASPLTDSLRRGTENLIMGGTGAGLAIGLDGTQELREPFSKDNLMFISPEAFGRDLAQLRMDVGSVVNLAKNKASEMGEDINEYVSRARSAYDQQMNQDMENQRMQELDAQQGMQPFSALLGPDMPLRRPEDDQQQDMQTEQQKALMRSLPDMQRRDIRDILNESGISISNTDSQYIDDILSDLEKKN